MKTNGMNFMATACAVALTATVAAPAGAQTTEIKEKPSMYTYEALWTIPRAKWPEVDKANASSQKVMEKALASGSIVGYGDDSNLVHEADGFTHDNWWSGMSMASVLNILDDLDAAGGPPPSALLAATKHQDEIFVSHYYNWRAGSWKGAYTSWSGYTLKADAPSNAVEMLAKNVIAPMMEKLLADGTIIEYEIDVQAVHTDAPGRFGVVYVTPKAEGIDKVRAAISERGKQSPLIGPAMDAITDYTKHRDSLVRSTVTYK